MNFLSKLAALLACATLFSVSAHARDKVVHHIDNAEAQATKGLRNVRNRNIKKEQFIMDAEFMPSGVVRIGQLQSREKYSYIKP